MIISILKHQNKMVNLVNFIPTKHQHVNIIFRSKYHCVQVQSHTAASMTVDS